MEVSVKVDEAAHIENPKSDSAAPKFSLADWGAEDKASDFENAGQVFPLDEELGNQEIDDNLLYFKNVSERDFQVVD
jgi:hypothetical protein